MTEQKYINFILKTLLFVWLLLLFFNNILEKLFGTFFTYLDEALLGIFVIVIITKFFTRFSIDKFTLVLLSFIFLNAIFSLKSAYHNSVFYTLAGLLIHVKWFAYILLLYFFFRNSHGYLKRLLQITFLVSVIGIVVNLFLGVDYNRSFEVETYYRNDFLRIVGFELDYNSIALFGTLIYIYYNFFNGLPSYTKFIGSSVVFFLFCVLIVGSRTPLSAAVVSGMFLLFNKRNKILNIFIFSFFITIGVAVILLFGGELVEITVRNMSSVTDETSYVRGLMIFFGFQLMMQYFPLGTGAATFGTKLSEGSIVYQKLGLAEHYMIKEMNGLYDSNLASLVGELGFLGFGFFVILLYQTYRFCRKRLHSSQMPYILILMITAFFFSIIGPIFMSGYSSALFALFINLQLSKNRIHLYEKGTPEFARLP